MIRIVAADRSLTMEALRRRLGHRERDSMRGRNKPRLYQSTEPPWGFTEAHKLVVANTELTEAIHDHFSGAAMRTRRLLESSVPSTSALRAGCLAAHRPSSSGRGHLDLLAKLAR
jgi:hypothetical protein